MSQPGLDSNNLSSDQLAQAIHKTVADAQLIESAKHWQNVVATEDGVGTAADCIEQHWQGMQGRESREVV